jgi:PRTRC genetic system protein E
VSPSHISSALSRRNFVFQELMPLLAQRLLVLTLCRTATDEICVNVIPRPLKTGEKEENNALSTPLSMTGTPAELDQELPQQLVEFVGAHLQLSSSLETAKQEIAAAAKSAKDAARKAATPKACASPATAARQENTNEGTGGSSTEILKPAATASAAPVATTQRLFETSGVEG